MRLNVELNTRGELLLAVVRGTVSFQATWHVLKEICDAAQQKQMVRILVDALGAHGLMGTVDRYTLGVKLVRYCGEHHLQPRLAFVGEAPVIDGFGILVAKNRGLIAERFPNWNKALKWVRATPGRAHPHPSD